MATFEITTPDGTFEVTAPEGATEAQVLAYAKANHKQQAPPTKQIISGPEAVSKSMQDELGSRSLPERFMAGVGSWVDDASLNLKQVFSKLTPEEKNRLLNNQEIAKDPAGMAGNIAGNLAATAVPGVAAERALAGVAGKMIPKVLAPTVAPTLGAAGAGAGMNMLTTPLNEGETRGDQALSGAVGGTLGNLGARALGRVARPIQSTPETQKLLAEGIVPTPGRAAGANSFLGRTEQKLENLFLVGDFIKNANTRSIEELNRAAVNGALPNGAKIKSIGRRAITEGQQLFDDAYEKALVGKTVNIKHAVLQ